MGSGPSKRVDRTLSSRRWCGCCSTGVHFSLCEEPKETDLHCANLLNTDSIFSAGSIHCDIRERVGRVELFIEALPARKITWTGNKSADPKAVEERTKEACFCLILGYFMGLWSMLKEMVSENNERGRTLFLE